MAKKDFCINCSEDIPFGTKICPFCGFNEEKFMNTPTGKTKMVKAKHKKEKLHFTDEEKLALGLYPKKGLFKLSLISNILNK